MRVDSLTIDNSIASLKDMSDIVADVKTALEQRINLQSYPTEERPVVLSQSVVVRMCLLTGLADKTPRRSEEVRELALPLSGTPYPTTFFTKSRIGNVIEALLKLRYHDVEAEWDAASFVSRVIGHEILRGRDLLMKEGGIDEWLRYSPLRGGGAAKRLRECHCATCSNS